MRHSNLFVEINALKHEEKMEDERKKRGKINKHKEERRKGTSKTKRETRVVSETRRREVPRDALRLVAILEV